MDLKLCLDDLDDGEELNSPQSTMDELMSALDVLEGHADDSIQASRDSELYWIKTLNERDEFILSNRQSIEDLQRLNHELREENDLLKYQLLQADDAKIAHALQDDASESIKLSAQLQTEVDELQKVIVPRLKEQNVALQERLVKCGQSYSDVFSRLRQERVRQHPNITKICQDLQKDREVQNEAERGVLKRQVEDLCDIYDKIIRGACEECEEYLVSIDRLEHENVQQSARERSLSASPRKSRPGSSMETDKYYMELLQTSENSNQILRQEVENLQKEMNSREQRMFNDTMARIENNNREQVEKMKLQMSELSHELSLLNVENRALREKILRSETDNEILSKQAKDTTIVNEELASLQLNLDSQLVQNRMLESRVKELQLIRVEHSTMCERVKADLLEACEKASHYRGEVAQLQQKLSESRELQSKFDDMNGRLHNQMAQLQTENGMLSNEVTQIQREVGVAHMLNEKDVTKQLEQTEIIKSLQDSQHLYQQEMKELTVKLESTEKLRQSANIKIKALRERLKTMQESWQKISTDTESSFTALRDQYQQQIKEYKSIIDSLKSQNTSLSTRIESMKKVTSQNNSSKVSNLEQQILEYQNLTGGYREENILLRKELKGIVQGLQPDEEEVPKSHRKIAKPDEFARLRDILSTAKSECENLQLHKAPRSRTSTAERNTSYSERTPSKYSSTTHEIKDLYERMTPDNSTTIVSSKPMYEPERKEKPWNTYHTSLSGKRLEPLAVSTPRKQHSADSNMYRAATQPEINSLPALSGRQSSITQEQLASKNTEYSRSKYNNSGNLRSGGLMDSSSLDNKRSTAASTQKYPVMTGIVKPYPTSKTKEIVEIKHRNSAELDPSKSFKPINPDDDAFTADISTKYQPVSLYKPSYTSGVRPSAMYSKPYHTDISSTSYATPYKSAYEPSSYKSKFSNSDSRSGDDYRNVSSDSAYGSPSRSFTKLPSVSSYTSSYHRKEYSLPSLTSARSRYSASARLGGDNSVSKVPPLFSAQQLITA